MKRSGFRHLSIRSRTRWSLIAIFDYRNNYFDILNASSVLHGPHSLSLTVEEAEIVLKTVSKLSVCRLCNTAVWQWGASVSQ